MLAAEDREEALDWVLEKLSAARKAQPVAPLVPDKKEELKAKQPKELELWKAYKASGFHPAKLNPLIKSFQGLLNERIRHFKNRVEIPVSVIDHVHKVEFVDALKSYDPKRGTQLNTHIFNRLRKAGRFIDANKNFAYIPENISKNIGFFNTFKAELSEKLGYEPDDQTIHDEAVKQRHPRLGLISLKEIKRLNREQRKGFVQKGHESDLLFPDELNPRELEVAHLIVFQLTPEERAVHEYTLGLNGKPKLAPGAIAKKLKMDNSKVSKLRSSAWAKMQPYLEG